MGERSGAAIAMFENGMLKSVADRLKECRTQNVHPLGPHHPGCETGSPSGSLYRVYRASLRGISPGPHRWTAAACLRPSVVLKVTRKNRAVAF